MVSVPACWTNYVPDDPFVEISDGRALFQAEDLLELRKRILVFKEMRDKENKGV